MKIVILDANTLGNDISLDGFNQFGETIVRQKTTPEELPDTIADADCLVLNKVKLPESVLQYAKKLKVILEAATGFDNIDTEYCRKNGIAVCNVPGYSTETVAQLTMAMAFSLATHLTEFNQYVKTGRYTSSGKANCLEPIFHDMNQRTYGVIGMGNIGKRVADIAKAVGMNVIYYRKHFDGNSNCVSLDELCTRADILSLHVPLSKETYHLIGKEQLEKMKKSAILINVARGAVVDEEAVAEAIINHQIAGFGCDVYSTEPMGKEHPYQKLLSLDNVLLTPHMAWGSHEARERCVESMCQNLAAFIKGEKRNRIV